MPKPTRQEKLLAQIATLQKQLAAVQTGAIAIAQGQSNVSAGAGCIAIGRDFRGNIYIGARPQNDAEALAIYRRMILSQCRHLPLRGFDLGASDPTAEPRHMDLDQVYVNLDTTAPLYEQKAVDPKGRPFRRQPTTVEKRRLPALEAAAQTRHVAILGNPGSGKSTFVNHLCLCLTGQGLEPKNKWRERLPGWSKKEVDLLPIPVTLRNFARALPEKLSPAQPCDLWKFISQRLCDQNLAFTQDLLLAALDKGEAIVLLDGLDEVPTQEQRRFVRNAIQVFAGRHACARILVTCRTLSYQDKRWKLAEFPDFTLAPFDDEKIDQFIAAWFADLQSLGRIKAEDASRLTQGLQSAIRRPDLRELASNPLLLTVMTLVHTHKGRLPDARALLYEEAVDILLWRWDQIRFSPEGEPVGLGQLLREAGRSEVDLKRMLWRLAFEAHEKGGTREKLADIGEVPLQNALRDLHPDRDLGWVGRMIDTVKIRAGLLLEREPNVYTFPHRTFQEYLAGAHLASSDKFALKANRLAEAGAFWREVILLAVGKLVYQSGDTDKPLALVAELCSTAEATTDLAWRKTWLAGQVLEEMGVNRVCETALGRDLLLRVRQRLARLLEVGALTPVERAAAGVVLGKLGDHRPGVGVKNGLPDLDWIKIPPGPFPMGNDKPEARYDDETPRFTCQLIHHPYLISRYQVTVAQYQTFVDAGGYDVKAKDYWTEAGWKWKQRNKVTAPEEFDPVYQTPNHPQVGVSWYEAVAFCRWFSKQLKLEVMLPSEVQWERAARHTEGRLYPWGNADQDVAQRCNLEETGIGHTCAVGLFPNGLAGCGAADLAGNVDEWCRTKWREDYTDYENNAEDGLDGDSARVLRGGAFLNGAGLVRCACRGRLGPSYRHRSFGFRLVASPFVSGR